MDIVKNPRNINNPDSKHAAARMARALDGSGPYDYQRDGKEKLRFSPGRKFAIGVLATATAALGGYEAGKRSANKESAPEERKTISFIAQEDDSLWDYAEKFYPDEDPRNVVDRLEDMPAYEDGLKKSQQVTLQVSQEIAEQFQREQEQANQQAGGK